MNSVKINYIRSVIYAGAGCRKVVSATARQLFSEGIGKYKGRSVIYSSEDIAKLLTMLELERIPLEAPADTSRAGAVGEGVSEKKAINAPHLNEVAINVLTQGCTCDGNPMPVTSMGYLTVKAQDLIRIDFDAFLVIENLETFQQIHRYRWVIDSEKVNRSTKPGESQRVVAIFLGDHHYKQNVVREVLETLGKKVMSMPDLDPSGLTIANSLPNLTHVIWPNHDIGQLKSIMRAHNRADLFGNQYQYAGSLDKAEHPEIAEAWSFLKSMNLGLHQEALLKFC